MINPLNQTPLAFPVLECLHILGFTCGVGSIALVDFRLLGAGLTGKPASQLWRDTLPWTLAGLALALSAGLLLFSINPDVYYLNEIFLFKMSALAVAILFHFTVIRKASTSKLAALISLALWTMVLCGGIFIGLSATRPPATAAPPSGIDFDQFLNGSAK